MLAREVAICEADLHARQEGYAVYFSESPGKAVAAILSWLEQAGDPLVDLRVERPTLEERFLEITSRYERAAASLLLRLQSRHP